MCLRRAPEKYIAGAALDRAGLWLFWLLTLGLYLEYATILFLKDEYGSIVQVSSTNLLTLRGWRFQVTLQLTVSQSVCLSIEHPCGTCDQILFLVGMLLSEICGLVSVGILSDERTGMQFAV
jgi:hypothetical protein